MNTFPIIKKPMPKRQACLESEFTTKLRITLTALQPGECFMLDTAEQQRHALRIAKRHGIRIVTRKVPREGWQVQLVEPK